MLSLTMFHRLFIVLSVILAAFVAAWATGEYRALGNAIYMITAAGSALAGGGLVVYLVTFQRKVRHL
jgi:hypothetical protein